MLSMLSFSVIFLDKFLFSFRFLILFLLLLHSENAKIDSPITNVITYFITNLGGAHMEVKAKLTKVGNSYAFFVPKPLIDCKVLQPGEKYKFEFKESVKIKKDAPEPVDNAAEVQRLPSNLLPNQIPSLGLNAQGDASCESWQGRSPAFIL